MQNKKHLFFDMDLTIAPPREPMLPAMHERLTSLPHDIVVVTGSLADQISFQTHQLPALYLAVNGNHAMDVNGNELWRNPDLDETHRDEIYAHIEKITAQLDHELNSEWHPIEDRGAQITFSPIGNRAPVEQKRTYDPDRKKRETWLADIPFLSDDIMVKIGGSTSFDYIHKERHKGANVRKLIEHMGWNTSDCVYFGDGLYPGGNDEVVIGVVDTVPVQDHHDTYQQLGEYFGYNTNNAMKK